ncbi:MAG: phosphate/phosphite/phosphonate ABC transporter substrate-binding protein [Deltaproteobacteria bacterium]|nr:phosphate/phosphite/phosphonate ABC transporter substrate-binding protein [Deltaproteobacteria bacterium]
MRTRSLSGSSGPSPTAEAALGARRADDPWKSPTGDDAYLAGIRRRPNDADGAGSAAGRRERAPRQAPRGGNAAGALFAVLCVSSACAVDQKADPHRAHADEPLPPLRARRISFGLTPYLGSHQTLERAGPLIEYLSKTVGVPVDARSAGSYEELVDLVAAGRVDLAALSPLTYVTATRHGADLEIVATPVERGSPTYLGYIVVRADDQRYRHVGDLAGARFAFVDRTSTSGYLYARALLREFGVDPDRDLGETIMAGSHPEVTRAVLEGRADAGAVGSSLFDPPNAILGSRDRLLVIGKTARIPFDAYCVRPDLDEGATRRIERALLAISASASLQRMVAAPLGFSGWVHGDDRRYDTVRAVLGAEGGRLTSGRSTSSPGR